MATKTTKLKMNPTEKLYFIQTYSDDKNQRKHKPIFILYYVKTNSLLHFFRGFDKGIVFYRKRLA